MNMKKAKKLVGMLLCCALAGTIFAGCGSNGSGTTPKSGESESIRIGMLANLNASEKMINDVMQKIQEETGNKVISPHSYIYYDNLNAMQMGLTSKSIDEMSTYRSVGNYLMDRHSEFVQADHPVLKLSDSFCCAVRKEDTALKDAMDKAITAMKEDGTLDMLAKQYITDLKKDGEPPKVEIAKIEGADTIKIAVTGDLPPIDLVLADGSPAGFNTAVLSEISKRLKKNVEIVSIESGARASALTSKRADVIFWAIVPTETAGRPADVDMPEGATLTTPYFKDDIIHIGLKK